MDVNIKTQLLKILDLRLYPQALYSDEERETFELGRQIVIYGAIGILECGSTLEDAVKWLRCLYSPLPVAHEQQRVGTQKYNILSSGLFWAAEAACTIMGGEFFESSYGRVKQPT